jgi:hypothetical protein
MMGAGVLFVLLILRRRRKKKAPTDSE